MITKPEQDYIDECLMAFRRYGLESSVAEDHLKRTALAAYRLGDMLLDKILSSEVIYEDILDAEVVATTEFQCWRDRFISGEVSLIDIANHYHLI